MSQVYRVRILYLRYTRMKNHHLIACTHLPYAYLYYVHTAINSTTLSRTKLKFHITIFNSNKSSQHASMLLVYVLTDVSL